MRKKTNTPSNLVLSELKSQTALLKTMLAELVKYQNVVRERGMDTYHTVGEAAKILKCSKTTINRLLSDGELEKIKFDHGVKRSKILITRKSIDNFVRRKKSRGLGYSSE